MLSRHSRYNCIRIYYFYFVWNLKAESTSGLNWNFYCHSEHGQSHFGSYVWQCLWLHQLVSGENGWCLSVHKGITGLVQNQWYLSDEQHSSKAWSYTLNSAHLWRAVWLPCKTAASSEELIIYCLLRARDSVCQCCMTIRAACSTSSIDACHGLLNNVIPQDVHGQSVACNLIWSMYLHKPVFCQEDICFLRAQIALVQKCLQLPV